MSNRCRHLIVCGLMLTAGLVASTVQANLITNGSFEQPAIPIGGITLFSAASPVPPTGWSVVGPGSLAIVSGSFTQFGFSFPAQDAAQWLDLTGLSSNQPIGIQQAVATVPGVTYDLSFWVGNVVGFGTGLTSTVNVLINGTPAFAATNSAGGTTLTWQEFETSFTATGTTTTLAFFNGDSRTDENNGLDNVVLVESGVAAPPSVGVAEPTSVALLGIGLMGVLTARRRRSTRQ
jgi:hypothetical protein